MILTEAQAQAILQRLYELDEEVPETTDDEYTTRRGLLNAGIQAWDREDLEWAELYTKLSSYSGEDADKTTVSGTATYDCPLDFRRPVGYLRVITSGTSTYYRRVEVNDVQLYANEPAAYIYYVTGNPSTGYDVTLSPTPTSTGDTIDYEYYKFPTELSATTSKFEMADPYFAIYYALHEMFSADGDGERSLSALEKMNNCLQKMKDQNLQTSANNMFGGMPDPFYTFNTGGFGK